MYLTSLSFLNFRSYDRKRFQFSKGMTVFLGPNAVGKTNILEGIFLVSTGKSFRAEEDRDLIKWGNELARVKAQVEDKEEPLDLEVVLTAGVVAGQKAPHKKYLVNGIGRRMVDFVGKFKTILFWPEDLKLVTDSPSIRRKYLNFVLVQLDREYRRSLLSYEKGLRQRNRVLEKIRKGEAARRELLFWDQLLIRTGNYLTAKREELIREVNETNKPFGVFSITYEASIISEARLSHYADAEVATGVTLVGPHRDDFLFFENKRDITKFGSRGEQRLSVVWLKLAELEYVKKVSDETPVLLLDDIFSELDHEHREWVMEIMRSQQTILTTTDRHFLPPGLIQEAEVVELSES
ncbi:DNA replication and repair protein RecF [Candidatus Gottesmanbacteria bacterium]|nr:DNA replication and repair protein RecF [Candidatus Gottesmanbacteria bacterium]